MLFHTKDKVLCWVIWIIIFFTQKESNQTYYLISERKKNSTVLIDNDEYQVNDSMGQIMITNDSG